MVPKDLAYKQYILKVQGCVRRTWKLLPFEWSVPNNSLGIFVSLFIFICLVSSIFIVILWVSLYFHFSRWMPSVTHPLEQSYRRLSKTSTDLFLAPSCEHHAFVKQNHPASLGWGSCEWRYELQILWAILTSFVLQERHVVLINRIFLQFRSALPDEPNPNPPSTFANKPINAIFIFPLLSELLMKNKYMNRKLFRKVRKGGPPPPPPP